MSKDDAVDHKLY